MAINAVNAPRNDFQKKNDKLAVYRVYDEQQGQIITRILTVFGGSGQQAVAVFRCESSLKQDAFNPETEAKKRGITKYSSCGIAQINSPLCTDKDNDGKLDADSPLYNVQYNLEQARTLYDARGWRPWLTCSKKLGILE